MTSDASVTAATLPADLGPDDVVLLGWPVAHSRSPAMHAAAAAHLGLSLRYRALAVAPEELDAVVDALGAAGIRGRTSRSRTSVRSSPIAMCWPTRRGSSVPCTR